MMQKPTTTGVLPKWYKSDHASAIQDITQSAIELNPVYVNAFYNRGWMKRALGVCGSMMYARITPKRLN